MQLQTRGGKGICELILKKICLKEELSAIIFNPSCSSPAFIVFLALRVFPVALLHLSFVLIHELNALLLGYLEGLLQTAPRAQELVGHPAQLLALLLMAIIRVLRTAAAVRSSLIGLLRRGRLVTPTEDEIK